MALVRQEGEAGRGVFLSSEFIYINKSATKNEQESVMQERRCECGRHIWVQYRHVGGGCRAKFWSLSLRAGRTVTLCPACGRGLSIDSLY